MDLSTGDLYENLYYRFVPVAVVSFLATVASYYVVTPLWSRKFCKKYSSFSPKQRADWNTRIYSTINASLVTCLVTYDLIWNTTMQDNPIWGHEEATATKYASAVIIGYMLADLIFVVIDFSINDAIAYGIHHLVVAFAAAHVLLFGALPYFTAFRLLAELSTPFINTWCLLIAAGYPKDHPSVVVSGVVMTIAFFGCRIAAMPVYYFMVYRSWATPEFYRLSANIRVSWLVCSVVLDILNTMWFTRLVRGATKQMARMKKERREVSNKAA